MAAFSVHKSQSQSLNGSPQSLSGSMSSRGKSPKARGCFAGANKIFFSHQITDPLSFQMIVKYSALRRTVSPETAIEPNWPNLLSTGKEIVKQRGVKAAYQVGESNTWRLEFHCGFVQIRIYFSTLCVVCGCVFNNDHSLQKSLRKR